jgi:hypothetical protein
MQPALDGVPSGCAGTLRIQVSISVDQYLRGVFVEAIDLDTGVSARKVLERDEMTHGDGVLEAYEAEVERHREADDVLRNTQSDWLFAGLWYVV